MLKNFEIRFKGDKVIWSILFFLSLLSLLSIYSSTGTLAFNHKAGDTEFYLWRRCAFLIVGWLCAYQVHRLPLIYIRKIAVWGYLISVFILGLNIIVGSRWVKIGGTFSLQFSEVAKVCTIITTAMLLTIEKDKVKEWSTFLLLLAPATIVSALVVPYNGSMAVLIFGSNIALLFMGRVRIKHLLVLIGAVVVSLFLGYLLVKAFPVMQEKGRVKTWVNRVDSHLGFGDGNGKGSYQITQSKIAIASGVLFGKMPGKSTQRYMLPEAHNDFIFAIIIEEYGVLVGILVMLLFLVLLYRTIHIFLRTEDYFNKFVVLGLGVMISMQAFLNIAVTTGVFPVTGQTLPTISQGGTSLVITFFAFGIIQAITSQGVGVDNEKQLDAVKGADIIGEEHDA